MTDATTALAGFVAEFRLEDAPLAVQDRAKRLIADSVGIAIRAAREAESTAPMMDALVTLGMATGRAPVFGDARGFAPPGAALANGALIHSLDFDDTHVEATIHPTAPVLGAALAAASIVDASGRSILEAVIAGYEVINRLGRALVPANHYDRGFHPTATAGVFGAAAAAGRVFGLSAVQLENAFGIGLSQSAGSLQFLENGAWTKRFQVGHAAMSGLTAASFADRGYEGATQAIEGRYGFLHSYTSNPRLEAATADLGEVWETMGIAVKPYPCCRFAHAALDGIAAIMTDRAFDWPSIAGIEIGLSRKGLDLTALPQEKRREPGNVVDAQFSMHFTAAVAARTGGLTWDDYATHLSDAETRALARRVDVSLDDEIDALYPKQMGARVVIRFAGGESVERVIRVPLGEPDNFLTDDALAAKFETLAGPVLGMPESRTRFQRLLALERERSTAVFFS